MSPGKALLRASLLAFAVLAALFILKFLTGERSIPPITGEHYPGSISFEMARKNYASQKLSGGVIAPGDAQKYEKVATIGQSTSNFDADRAKVDALIASSGGLTQYEQQQGLAGHRTLQLGIGVPPAKFDLFIEEARKIAKLTSLTIVKTDKTNEYRQLRAKRETLEKALKALTDMAGAGGSVDERLKVQARLTEIEEKIQDLGVSLGDFNAENEFCTVKLTLAEIEPPLNSSAAARALRAFFWALEHFIFLAVGLFLLAFAAWLAARAVVTIAKAWSRPSDT
jgi:uncharacterized protein YfcZ (UPF0381/DUF406 family)